MIEAAFLRHRKWIPVTTGTIQLPDGMVSAEQMLSVETCLLFLTANYCAVKRPWRRISYSRFPKLVESLIAFQIPTLPPTGKGSSLSSTKMPLSATHGDYYRSLLLVQTREL